MENLVLSADNSDLLAQTPPTPTLKLLAQGESPSHEHTGIAARLVYQMEGGAHWTLDRLPTLFDPESWMNPDRVAQLILAYFQPWRVWRFDPSTETLAVALSSGQWSFRLKGLDSNTESRNFVSGYLDTLLHDGFDTISTWLLQTELIKFPTPSDTESMTADEIVGVLLKKCKSAFTKYVSTFPTIALTGRIAAHPLMRFDRSTVGTLTGYAAFANGVVPTDDILDDPDESGIEHVRYPAGILIPANIEFLLPSAAGVEWPTDERWNRLMEYRKYIQGFETEDSWDDWLRAAITEADSILATKAKTYKSFLDHAFPHGADEPPTERDAFLRTLGAVCFGSGLKLVVAMIGAANAGKDTAIGWLAQILGTQQVANLAQSALTSQSDDQRAFAPLKGARVAVISGEVGEGRQNGLLADKLKSITSGGGFLTVAEKYEKPSSIFFDGALVIQGNSVPTIIGGDEALYQNRLIPVPFRNPFPLRADTAMFKRLYTREAPAFLQVLFVHYLNYMYNGGGRDGINPPEEWLSFGKEITTNADPLTVIDSCLTRPNKDEISISASVFYKALNILASNHLGLRHDLSSVRWAARLKRAGVIYEKHNNEFRSRPQGTNWVLHFTLDASRSDGIFSQQDWEQALQTASVTIS